MLGWRAAIPIVADGFLDGNSEMLERLVCEFTRAGCPPATRKTLSVMPPTAADLQVGRLRETDRLWEGKALISRHLPEIAVRYLAGDNKESRAVVDAPPANTDHRKPTNTRTSPRDQQDADLMGIQELTGRSWVR
jgi:hypothetical protein